MYESVTLSLTGDKTSLETNYFPPINVYEDAEIALLSLQTYNSFPNINSSNNCFKIIPVWKNNPNSPRSVTLEPGCYEFVDIKKCFLDVMEELNLDEGFEMDVDSKTLKCFFKCSCKIDFNVENSLASVLGFDKILYEEGKTHTSFNIININSVNTIKVMCNIAQGSFHNDKPSHAVYEFYPDVNIGRKIIQSPNNLIYYPLTTKTIDSIRVDLVDQDHNRLHHLNEKLTIILHIRRYGS